MLNDLNLYRTPNCRSGFSTVQEYPKMEFRQLFEWEIYFVYM